MNRADIMGGLADPGTADWMAPEQPLGPQPVMPDQRLRLPITMGGLAAMDQYNEAPTNPYEAYDKAKREEARRARILATPMPGQVERPPMIQYTPETLARDRAMMEFGRDMLVPQSPLDVGLMVAGGPVGGKLLRGGAAALGALFEADQAEARGKVGSYVADILNVGRKPHGTASNWILRYDPSSGQPNLVNASTGNQHAFSGLATGLPPDKMSYVVSGAPSTKLPVYDPAAYFAELQRQKAELIFGVSDRMAGGGQLVQAGKTKFRNPIPQEAGINYPLIHEGKEIPGIPGDLTPLFASVSKGAAGKTINPALDVLESGGVPYFAAVNMTHKAGDSTKQMANTVYRALKQSRPDADAIAKIDAEVMKKINAAGEPPSPYPGSASKQLPKWLDDAGLTFRNAFVQGSDMGKVQAATNVDVGLLRYANTDPRLRSTPSGSAGLLIGKMRPEAGYSDFPLHSNYPFTIWGERGQIGSLPGSIPFSLIGPKMHRAMLPVTNQGVSLANIPHTSVMRGMPGGLTRQPVNDEVVNNVGEWFRTHPQGWSIAGGVPLGAGMMGDIATQDRYD